MTAQPKPTEPTWFLSTGNGAAMPSGFVERETIRDMVRRAILAQDIGLTDYARSLQRRALHIIEGDDLPETLPHDGEATVTPRPFTGIYKGGL